MAHFTDIRLLWFTVCKCRVSASRGHLTHEDLELLGNAFGWGQLQLLQHMVRPLLAAAMSRIGVPPELNVMEKVVEKAVVNGTSSASEAFVAAVDSVLQQDIAVRDVQAIAAAYGLEAEQLFEPMLAGIFTKACASKATVSHGAVSSLSAERLVSAAREALTTGMPSFEALEALAPTANISLDACIQSLLLHLLTGVSAPPEVLELVQSAHHTQLYGSRDLRVLLPTLMKQRYLTFVDAEMLGLIWGFDPSILGDAEALAANTLRAAAHQEQASQLMQLQAAISRVRQRGYPKYSEVHLLADFLGFGEELSSLVAELLRLTFSLVVRGSTSQELEPLEAAVLQSVAVQVLDRGHPTFADAKALAEVFGIKLVDHVLLPLINRTLPMLLPALQQSQQSLVLDVLANDAVPAALLSGDITKVRVADLEALATALGLDVAELMYPLINGALLQINDDLPLPVDHSKVEQVRAAMRGMMDRGYPVYADVVIVAGLFGLEPSDLVLQLLLWLLERIGAPETLKDLLRQAEDVDEVALSAVLPEMLERGYPVYSDFEMLAAAFNADLVKDILKPLLITALVKVGAPQSLVDRVMNFQPDSQELSELGDLLPRVLERGYPFYSEVEIVAGMLGVDPLEHLLQPLVVAVLKEIGAEGDVVDRIVQFSLDSSNQAVVRSNIISWRQRGYPTYAEVDALAAAFGLDIPSLLRPLILTFLRDVGIPQSVLDRLQTAQVDISQIQAVRQSLPEMTSRGYPTCSELDSLAKLFALDVEDDFIKPLLAAALDTVGASSAVSTVEAWSGSCAELEAALTNILHRGYPSFADLREIAQVVDVNLNTILAQMTDGGQESEVAQALLRLQTLVSEGQTLLSVVSSGSDTAAVDFASKLSDLLTDASNSLDTDAAEGQAGEDFEQGALASMESIGGPALRQVESYLAAKLENPAGHASTLLGMSLGDGTPLCPGQVDASLDIFLDGLQRVKGHRTVQSLQELASMILEVSEMGYALLDALRQIPVLAAAAQEGGKYQHLPLVGVVFRGLNEVGSRLSHIWKASFEQPAQRLDANILEPASKLGNAIHTLMTQALHSLDAVGLALSNLLRPPSRVFQDIAKQLNICELLKTALPLPETVGFLLQILEPGGVPVYSLWPSNPFDGVSRFVHGAAANVKRRFEFVLRQLQALMDLMEREHKLCAFGYCYRITTTQLLQKSTSMKDKFGFVLDKLQHELHPLRNVKAMIFKALDGLTADFLSPTSVDFLPSARRLAAQAASTPSWNNLPDIASVARRFQSPDLVDAVATEQATALQGCVFPDTGLADENSRAVHECDDRRLVHWEAQCDAQCFACEACARWFITLDETGGKTCNLRSADAGYVAQPGAMLGLGRMCDKQGQESILWEKTGLSNRCAGMFESGVQSERECVLFCGHDSACEVYQFRNGVCLLGQSRRCSGDSGWVGGRKKMSAGQEMKEACGNFDLASDLQNSGQAQLEPTLQSAVDMSQSTCFQAVCDLASADMDCSDNARRHMDRTLKDHCEAIPHWQVGPWGVCGQTSSIVGYFHAGCGMDSIRSRTVACSHPESARCQALAPEPPSVQPCVVTGNCRWSTDSLWGSCEGATCETAGTKVRGVGCNGPESACAAKGEKPASISTCFADGCDAADPCVARRLHAEWGGLSSMPDVSSPPFQEVLVLNHSWHTTRRLEELSEQKIALSAQECMDLSARAGYCTMVHMSEGGPAGIDFQMTTCMSQQLDTILAEVRNVDSKVDELTGIMTDGFSRINSEIDQQTEALTGARERIHAWFRAHCAMRFNLWCQTAAACVRFSGISFPNLLS